MTDTPEPPNVHVTTEVQAITPDPGDANRKLGLHPLVTTLVVVYFVILIGGTVGVAVWRDKMDLVDGLFASVFISALVIAIPSWLAWRIARSRLAGNITCAVIVGLMLAGFGSSIMTAMQTRTDNNAALDKFDKTLDTNLDSQSDLIDRAIAGEDVSDEMADRFDKNMSNLEQLGNDSSGQQAKVFTAMAKVMRRIEAPALAYNDAFNQFFEAGGIDPATLENPGANAERLKMVETFAAANEQFDAVYASLESDLRTRLLAQNISKDRVEFLISKWWQGARPDLINQIRQTDRELVGSFRGILNTLDAAQGRWRMDSDMVIIEDDALLEQYNTHFDRMIEVSTRQEALQRQVQQVMNKAQASP